MTLNLNTSSSSNPADNYSELRSAIFQSRVTSGALDSPTRQLSINVKFWYYLGAGTSSLEVLQLPSDTLTYKSESIIQQTPETVGKWTETVVNFCLISKDGTRIVIRVLAGDNFTSAGLDEIVTYRNSGKPSFVPQTLPDDFVACAHLSFQ